MAYRAITVIHFNKEQSSELAALLPLARAHTRMRTLLSTTDHRAITAEPSVLFSGPCIDLVVGVQRVRCLCADGFIRLIVELTDAAAP